MRDLRHALRTLRRSPGFTAVAAFTLALGIGANTALFSVAYPLIERPLPIPELDRVAAVATGVKGAVAPADYSDWKRSAQSFVELAAYRERSADLTGDAAPPQRVSVAEVMPDFFTVVRLEPALGRLPAADEEDALRNRVVVLSDGFRRRRFGADSDVLSRLLVLDGTPYTIVGVMPESAEFPAPTDVWTPLVLTGAERSARGDGARRLRVVGRLAPAATIASAQTEMSAIAARLADAYPATNAGRRVNVMPLAQFVQGSILRGALFLLLGLVSVVLLIAAVNIAGLQLARGTARAGEIAVRAALGATRRRIVRMLLIENLALAAVGGAAGILVASGLLRLLVDSMPGEIARAIPGWNRIGLDARALAFTAALALGSGVAAGLLPAWTASRGNPNEALKEGARRTSAAPARSRLRSAFVVGQIAAALALVATGALFLLGFRGLFALAGAHDPDRVLLLSLDLPPSRYADERSIVQFDEALLQRLESLPGVASAAALSTIPLSNNGTQWARVDVEGRPDVPGFGAIAVVQRVSPSFFDTLHVGLRAGRAFG
ncbi:MAG TPA: ABC transporter permease, partial [Gammaproteobacteria bacterium]|nr:ABC transporter permease [Gammaproteobacteria bacterium]